MTESVNGFLFRGEIRGYWRLLARGADPASIVQHRHKDRRFDFGLDDSGFAKRNGGIISPTDRTLGTGRFLYRFVGTQSYAKRKSSAVLGHWWLDEDNWQLLREFARASPVPLERAAQIFLALPEEWGDRGRVARGRLRLPIMAWSGIGNIAAGREGNHTPAQHSKAVQLFLPGDAEVIGRAFGSADEVECIYTRDCPKVW